MSDTTTTATASKPNRAVNGTAILVAVAGALLATPGVSTHLPADVVEMAKTVITINDSFNAGQIAGVAAVIAAVTTPPKALVKLGKSIAKGVTKGVRKLFGKGK